MNGSKLLGIDHGEARIGLAVSDDLGMLAHPLETVPARDAEAALARIVELVGERGVTGIVLGLPLRLDGSEGTAAAKVRAFGKALRARLPDGIAWHEQDERLSTVSAMEKLHASGRTAKNTRAIIDQAAAVEILQAFLDQCQDVERGDGSFEMDEWGPEEEDEFNG